MKRWLPTREQLRGSRWLRPLARHLDDDRLWHLNRASVARGTAIGLFFGFVLPFAQIPFAVATAVALRAHLAVAAAATFVSNPLTFPPIYWAGYRIGRLVLGEPRDEAGALQLEHRTEALIEQQNVFEGVWNALQSAGAPLVVGLLAMGVAGAALGYALVWLLWRDGAGHDGPR